MVSLGSVKKGDCPASGNLRSWTPPEHIFTTNGPFFVLVRTLKLTDAPHATLASDHKALSIPRLFVSPPPFA